jgi:hypothetical protein
VLGAGFSRSLGGPLLQDLLSVASRFRVYAEYGAVLAQDVTDPVYWLYHFGSNFEEGTLDPTVKMQGARLWRNAEEFLEVLDEAAASPRREQALKDAWKRARAGLPDQRGFENELPDAASLRDAATRLIAASCSVFIEGLDRETIKAGERWKPYQAWIRELRENDTLVTFNYDRVVEQLSAEEYAGSGSSSLFTAHVMEPGTKPEALEEDSIARLARRATLVKAHGSVNWVLCNAGIEKRDWSPDLLSSENKLALAIPGASKHTMATSFFRKLWRQARVALEAAEEIFFLGFRFPESDAAAREMVLDAIGGNGRPGLIVTTVLGPDTRGLDSARLIELVRWAAGASRVSYELGKPDETERSIVAAPFYVEDFLDGWSREQGRERG